MATLGSAIISKVLGHSEAENLFRPWWDKIEDLLVYGLVMLGLVVVPTSMVIGSPLECTYCSGDLCKSFGHTGTASDPKFYMVWVKKLCTFNGSVDYFMLYFPYILLLIALTVVLIEKIFIALFKANKKLEKFYQLLLDENILQGGSGQGGALKREAIELEEGFNCSEENFSSSYLVRTSLELIITSLLLVWILLSGVPVIFTVADIIPCKIDTYMYACSGHPQQFYKFILCLAIVFIISYILTNIYNLLWILKPENRKFDKIILTYRDYLKTSGQIDQITRLDELYFQNTDLRLLTNLLAGNLGIGVGLSALGLFYKELHQSISAQIVRIKKTEDAKTMIVKIQKPSEALLSIARHLTDFSRVKLIVELTPQSENHPALLDYEDCDVEVMFTELDMDKIDSITATILANGKVISTTKQNIDTIEELDITAENNNDGLDKKNK